MEALLFTGKITFPLGQLLPITTHEKAVLPALMFTLFVNLWTLIWRLKINSQLHLH